MQAEAYRQYSDEDTVPTETRLFWLFPTTLSKSLINPLRNIDMGILILLAVLSFFKALEDGKWSADHGIQLLMDLLATLGYCIFAVILYASSKKCCECTSSPKQLCESSAEYIKIRIIGCKTVIVWTATCIIVNVLFYFRESRYPHTHTGGSAMEAELSFGSAFWPNISLVLLVLLFKGLEEAHKDLSVMRVRFWCNNNTQEVELKEYSDRLESAFDMEAKTASKTLRESFEPNSPMFSPVKQPQLRFALSKDSSDELRNESRCELNLINSHATL